MDPAKPKEPDLSYFRKPAEAYAEYVRIADSLCPPASNEAARLAHHYLASASWGFHACGIRALPAISRALKAPHKHPFAMETLRYAASELIRREGFAREFVDLLRTDPAFHEEFMGEGGLEALPKRVRAEVEAQLGR